MTEPLISCEFFPPKTDEGSERLRGVCEQLAVLKPEFFSVTYGAGGSTRQRTFSAVDMLKEMGCNAAPHLASVGSSREELREILFEYRDAGINRVVALRGDPPGGMGWNQGDFQYANELVSFIREETGDHFTIEVAAYPEYHPQAETPKADIDNFARKVEAGADSALTQYFYNDGAYFSFLDECAKRGVEIPIVPGIMPITNFTNLARFSDMCGAEIPRWIRLKLRSFGDDKQSIADFGADVVSQLCERLLVGGAPGLHFYTMNQATATLRICENLNLIKPD
ncbi:MAG: methylenetetrahydrofolate reductase [NAD(P)H] [Gammaproteobacteria bacterium]